MKRQISAPCGCISLIDLDASTMDLAVAITLDKNISTCLLHKEENRQPVEDNPITVTVQIGNSDDKLSQKRWAGFIKRVQKICYDALDLHFSGGSRQDTDWQNYCFVGVASKRYWVDYLRAELARLARDFGQDSIAMTTGETEFIKGGEE